MKSKIEKQEFIDAHQVTEEIIEAIESGKRLSECDNISHFVNNPKHKNKIQENLVKGDMFDKTYLYIQSRDKEEDIRKLIDDLNSGKRNRKLNRKKIGSIVSSIAAVLIVISFIVRTVHNNLSDNVTYLSYHEIVPNAKSPILILSSGESVELTEMSEETRSAEFKKVGDNKLKYNSGITFPDSVKYNTIIVPTGFSYTVEFNDGSQVTLNAGSKLTYPIYFDGTQRVVELSGEAFFDVAKSEIPFIVESQIGKVKVYGTTFNLYTKQNSLEAVLVSGSIGFTPNDKEEILLESGQMLSCNSEGDCNLKEVEIYEYTAWRDNNFIFVDQPLERVLVEISKWYGIEIGYKNDYNIDLVQITLMLNRDTPLDITLKTLSETLKIKIIKEGRRQYIIE